MSRSAAVILASLLLLSVAGQITSGQETHPVRPAERPAVLFVADGRRGAPASIRTWDDWLEAGFEVDAKPIAEIESLDDLSPYNAMVINFLPSVDSERKAAPEQVVFEKVMDAYLRAGGGVVVFCGGGQWHGMSPALRHLLGPYGASVPEEQIVDPENEIGHLLDGRIVCNQTTAIADALMTRGISLIGYVGFAEVGRNPNPWFEMKQASCFSVYTTRHGVAADDARKSYFASCYNMENYLPLDYHLVATPAEVAEAAGGRVNVFTGGTVGDLYDYMQGSGKFQGRDLFWESPHHWYLTSGPKLLRNGGRNLGNLAINQERENLFRYGFQLSGLRAGDQIRLMDGPTVYRQWIATGDRFATEHTWPHEQTRVFIVQVVRRGKTILLGSPVTLSYGRRFNQCGDRQNTIPYNYQPDDTGKWHVCGIPIGCKYKSWDPNTLVYATAKTWQIGAIGVEIVPDRIRSWFTSPLLEFDPPRRQQAAGLASHQTHRLSCPGVLMVDETTDRVYPDGGRHLGDCQPAKLTQPLELFRLKQRRYGLYGMVGQLNGQLVESRITILDDVSLKSGRTAVRVSGDNYAVRPNVQPSVETCLGGKITRTPVPAKLRWHEPEKLAPGDYVGSYPCGFAWGGAQYAVSDNLWVGYRQTHRSGFYLKLPEKLNKADTFDFSILYTTGGSLPDRPASDYQKVQSFLGFSGNFPGLTNLSGGRLLDTPVIATIQTTPESEVRFSTVRNVGDPIGLTVRIRGFNPHWQVAYLLDDSQTWRYFGQSDGDFYANFYTKIAGHSMVAGHPVTCDQPKLRIALDDPLGRQTAFEIYNPTARPIQARLKRNATFFRQGKRLPAASIRVEVAPFASISVSMNPAQEQPAEDRQASQVGQGLP